MRIWYTKKLGKVTGPFTSEDIIAMLHAHRLDEESLIRKSRDGEWMKYYELRHCFEEKSVNPVKPLPSFTPPQPEAQRFGNSQEIDIQGNSSFTSENLSLSFGNMVFGAVILMQVLLISLILVFYTAKIDNREHRDRGHNTRQENPYRKVINKNNETNESDKSGVVNSLNILQEEPARNLIKNSEESSGKAKNTQESERGANQEEATIEIMKQLNKANRSTRNSVNEANAFIHGYGNEKPADIRISP